MDWSKIATFASVISLPASIVLYIGWLVNYGPKVMSRQMLVVTIVFVCFLTILGVTTVSVFKIAQERLQTGAETMRTAERAASASDLPKSLYVGRINVDAQHLAHDYYLEITMTGFNGTKSTTVITGIDGFVRYRKRTNGQSVDQGELPTPRIDDTKSYNLNAPSRSEFWIVLEQRLPSALAANMSTTLSSKGTVDLDFSSLNIWVALQDQLADRRRLSVWDGVSCQQLDNKMLVGRIVHASAQISVGTKATIE